MPRAQSSTVFNRQPISLSDGAGGFLSWATEFYFQAANPGCVEQGPVDMDICGSGFTFTMQSVGPSSRGMHGGDLGYGNVVEGAMGISQGFFSIRKSIAVEFDFIRSPVLGETDGNTLPSS